MKVKIFLLPMLLSALIMLSGCGDSARIASLPADEPDAPAADVRESVREIVLLLRPDAESAPLELRFAGTQEIGGKQCYLYYSYVDRGRYYEQLDTIGVQAGEERYYQLDGETGEFRALILGETLKGE